MFSLCVCSGLPNGRQHSSDTYRIQSGLREGGALLLFVFKFPLECAIRKVQETRRLKLIGNTSAPHLCR